MGDLDELENIAKNQVVDEVFITLPMKSFYQQIEKILKFCEQAGIETEISADIFKVNSSKTNIQKYDDMKVHKLLYKSRDELEIGNKTIYRYNFFTYFIDYFHSIVSYCWNY